jgi:nucleotide-binding universal stress UspA family protein
MSHIVVAVTLADDCLGSMGVACGFADRLGARVTAVCCVPELAPGSTAPLGHPAHRRVSEWIRRALPAGLAMPRVLVRGGIPAIELARIADESQADLLVIGRCGPPEAGSLVDAVLRRSRRPCLVLPGCGGDLTPMLAALDGTERGLQVHERALALADRLAVPLAEVTVQPLAYGGATAPPSERASRLLSRVRTPARHAEVGLSVALQSPPLHVRTGDPVAEVLAEVSERGIGMLVVGWRWGGPSDRVPVGSVGRRLALEAPCAVLTVPI